MRFFWKLVIGFLAVTGAVAIGAGFFDIEFGNSNFWDFHGIFFLIFITAFPRLTLLFSGVATGGILWWVAWVFAPRLLVAVLATLAYWNQNPLLVVISWLIALGGESSEKFVVVRRSGYSKSKASKRETKHVKAQIE